MEIEASIEAVRAALERDERVSAALLFGSAAKGMARRSSDLDIALIARSERDAAALEASDLDLTARLALAAERDVHLVLPERVEPVLGRQAFLGARVLFDRDPRRAADILERILIEYFDGEYHRRMRAEELEGAENRAVVDRDVLLRKSEAIEHHASRLRAALPLEPARLEADEGLRNDVCFALLQAIQACIDLAVHTCTHESLGVPESPAAAFALLERNGVIPAQPTLRLSRAAGLRNLIVHRYTDIMTSKLVEAIATGLSDLDDFVAALRRHSERPGISAGGNGAR